MRRMKHGWHQATWRRQRGRTSPRSRSQTSSRLLLFLLFLKLHLLLLLARKRKESASQSSTSLPPRKQFWASSASDGITLGCYLLFPCTFFPFFSFFFFLLLSFFSGLFSSSSVYNKAHAYTPPYFIQQTDIYALTMQCTHSMPGSFPCILFLHSNMNSAFTCTPFQSPSFNLQQRPLSRQQQITVKWGRRRHFSLKPIQGPNATGGVNNTYRRGNTLPSSPLSDVIQEFYSSLNDKDSAQLKKLISPDCIIEDTAYYKPLDIKNTHTYFTRLMEAMGKNVKFAIDEVCQGVEPTVAVMWHLEWNGKTIPFAKGCSFYICSADGEAPLIRKVHIFDESPLKPGKMALEILNLVTNLFDTLPNIAECFLKNPEALVQSFARFYKFCVKPFLVPLLAYYTHFWSYVAQGLTMVLNILYNIFRRFM